MGLSISKPSQYGVNATYWHIDEVIFSDKKQVAKVSMLGFLDMDNRQNNSLPLLHVVLSFGEIPPSLAGRPNVQSIPYPFTVNGNRVEEAYSAVKSLPEWQSAEDC
jgi:hypothetical protein